MSSNRVKSKKKTLNVSITSNPEFLREGSAVFDFENPERIVIGTNCKDSSRLLLKLYESITPQTNYILTDPTSAEIIKYSSNSFLATKISFINQVSRLADHFNGDIECISNAIGLDSRIGNKFLKSGMGFGGSCFPKDLRALISIEDKLNLKNSIFREALKINEAQLEFFYKKILNRYSSNLNFCSFTVWGLSFKSGTNDIRESPALKLIKLLLPNVSHLYIYDSLVTQSQLKMSKQDLKKISFINTPYEKIKESNALIICNDDKEFCFPNFKYLRLLKDKVIFDGRNCIHSLKELCHNKLSYISLGRKVIY